MRTVFRAITFAGRWARRSSDGEGLCLIATWASFARQRLRYRRRNHPLADISRSRSFAIYAFAIIHQGHYLLVRCGHECEGAWTGALSFTSMARSSVMSRATTGIPAGRKRFAGYRAGKQRHDRDRTCRHRHRRHRYRLSDLFKPCDGNLRPSSRFDDDCLPGAAWRFEHCIHLAVSRWAAVRDTDAVPGFEFHVADVAKYQSRARSGNARRLSLHGGPGGAAGPHISDILHRSGIARAPGRMTVSRLLCLPCRLASWPSSSSSAAALPMSLCRSSSPHSSVHPAAWRRGLGIDRIAQITACGLIVGALTLAAMTQSVSPEYAKEGRLFGNIWHRVVISLSMHAAWPFGRLQEMFLA